LGDDVGKLRRGKERKISASCALRVLDVKIVKTYSTTGAAAGEKLSREVQDVA